MNEVGRTAIRVGEHHALIRDMNEAIFMYDYQARNLSLYTINGNALKLHTTSSNITIYSRVMTLHGWMLSRKRGKKVAVKSPSC